MKYPFLWSKLTFNAGALLALGLGGAAPAWADDTTATETPPPAAAPTTPASCASPRDLVTTDCRLSWLGIEFYGTIDVGAGWQSHGAPLDPRYPPGASYLIQKMNRTPMWGLAPGPMSQSNIGLMGKEPIGAGWSFVFDLEAGFSPYSLQLANGPASQIRNAGVPLVNQATNGDGSKEGQWYNDEGYAGISSERYGTLTAFWQNSLPLDGVVAYDPMGGAYAFSPIGFHGDACGPGDTESCRSTSLKYRVTIGGIRAAALWQFGGYSTGDGARGAYEAQVGTDFRNLDNGTLSVDGIFSYLRDAVSTNVTSGAAAVDGNGTPIAPYLPQTLVATISNITGAMALASYAKGPVKWYGGYEWMQYAPPSDAVDAFTDLSGTPIGTAFNNNTEVNNTAFSASAGDRDRIEQIIWTGIRYTVVENVTLTGAYYHLFQNNYFAAGSANSGCSTAAHAQCSGALDAVSAVVDWKFAAKWDTYLGCMYSQVSGGMANGYLQRNNVDPTVGLRFRF